MIQSANGLGNIFGVLLVNWMADRKGKKFSIIFTILLASIGSYCLLLGILN